jgi:hypothetical protein
VKVAVEVATDDVRGGDGVAVEEAVAVTISAE